MSRFSVIWNISLSLISFPSAVILVITCFLSEGKSALLVALISYGIAATILISAGIAFYFILVSIALDKKNGLAPYMVETYYIILFKII